MPRFAHLYIAFEIKFKKCGKPFLLFVYSVQRCKHVVKHIHGFGTLNTTLLGRTKSGKSVIPVRAAPAAELYEKYSDPYRTAWPKEHI